MVAGDMACPPIRPEDRSASVDGKTRSRTLPPQPPPKHTGAVATSHWGSCDAGEMGVGGRSG